MTNSSVGEKSLTCQEHLFAEKTKEPDEGWVAAQITRANNCLFMWIARLVNFLKGKKLSAHVAN